MITLTRRFEISCDLLEECVVGEATIAVGNAEELFELVSTLFDVVSHLFVRLSINSQDSR